MFKEKTIHSHKTRLFLTVDAAHINNREYSGVFQRMARMQYSKSTPDILAFNPRGTFDFFSLGFTIS